MSYPSMGYPALIVPAVTLHIPVMWYLFYIQLTMCLVGVWLFYTEFNVDVHWGSVIGLLPFVACMALMQTAALPCFLVLCAVVTYRHESYWASALFLSLCILFRTELVILFLAYVLARKGQRAVVVFGLPLVLLVALTGSPMSTNTPAVFYGSLGQLKGNPWHLTFADSCIERVARENGVEPWSEEGAELFTRLSSQAVVNHMEWYAAKCVENGARALLTGPYIGEWRVTKWNWMKYPLHAIFGCVLLWLFFGVPRKSFLFWCVVLLLFSQAVGNQMVRHWNVIYLPLLGVVIESRRKRWEMDLVNYSEL